MQKQQQKKKPTIGNKNTISTPRDWARCLSRNQTYPVRQAQDSWAGTTILAPQNENSKPLNVVTTCCGTTEVAVRKWLSSKDHKNECKSSLCKYIEGCCCVLTSQDNEMGFWLWVWDWLKTSPGPLCRAILFSQKTRNTHTQHTELSFNLYCPQGK